MGDGLRYEVFDAAGKKDDRTFPYTLRGLLDALDYASILSMRAGPQVLMAGEKVIRRFEDGRECLRGTVAAMDYGYRSRAGGLRRLPLGKTRSPERRTLAKVASTPERGLKNEATARAYSRPVSLP